MRFLLVLVFLYSLPVLGQNKFHDLNVETAYGGKFDMSQFKGQKVVVTAISIENLKKRSTLQFWDSLKTANPKIGFLLIPANDVGADSDDSTAMREVMVRTPEKIMLSGAGRVKKDNGDKQHPIMQWLTDVKKNRHFDMEVESDVQIYVVSESGELYAVLTKDTRLEVLNEVLKQDDVPPPVFADMRP